MKISYKWLMVVALFIGLTTEGIAQQNGQQSKIMLQRKERKTAYKLNLLSPFYGTVNIAWQKVISNEGSFQLTLSYTDFDSYGSTNNGDGLDTYHNRTEGNVSILEETEVEGQLTKGFTIVPEYRFMLNGKNLSGIYVAPFMRYMYYEYSRDLFITTRTTTYPPPFYSSDISSRNTSDLHTYHALGLGITVGKQYIFKNRVAIDFFAGPVYSFILASNTGVQKKNDIVIGSGIPNTYLKGYGVRAGFTIGLVH